MVLSFVHRELDQVGCQVAETRPTPLCPPILDDDALALAKIFWLLGTDLVLDDLDGSDSPEGFERVVEVRSRHVKC
jgi:hypothetical protein